MKRKKMIHWLFDHIISDEGISKIYELQEFSIWKNSGNRLAE